MAWQLWSLLSHGLFVMAIESEPTVMLQRAKSPSPAEILCSCSDRCPTVAEAKGFIFNSCLRDVQQELLCRRGVDAAFAGRALDATFDAAMCPVLENVFHQLIELQNLSIPAPLPMEVNPETSFWRERVRSSLDVPGTGDAVAEALSHHYSAETADGNKSLNIGTVIITHGDANNVTVSSDHSADVDMENMGNDMDTASNDVIPFMNGHEVDVGSKNNVPIGSYNAGPTASGNSIPIGNGNFQPLISGNVVQIPVGSGNTNNILVPIGSGNDVFVPVGSGNQVFVPVTSGNFVVIPVGNNNIINIGNLSVPVESGNIVVIPVGTKNVVNLGNGSSTISATTTTTTLTSSSI